MKKLLFVNNNMYIGGVQKALVNLLNEIHDRYDITLLLFYKGGALMEQIPNDVRVIEAPFPLCCWGMNQKDAKSFCNRLGRIFFAVITRLLGRKLALRIAFSRKMRLPKYDVAISYLHSGADKVFYGGCNEFVLYSMDAEKKLTFIHCDYKLSGADTLNNAKLYSRFDGIVACSDGCRDAFIRCLPELKDRTVTIENCQNYELVSTCANKEVHILEKGKLNIVCVSRFGREKGMLRAIHALAAIGERINKLKCTFIGDGKELPAAKKLADDLGLSDSIAFLGEKMNPYGFISAADILLIPSYSEAAPLVIGEAACLATPILSTETSSAREMIEKTGFGWVVENSETGIKVGIEMLLDHPELITEKRECMKGMLFDNKAAVESFTRVVGE